MRRMKFSRQGCIILLNYGKCKLKYQQKAVQLSPELEPPVQGEGTLCQAFSESLNFTAYKPVLSKLPIGIPLIWKDQVRKPAP